MVDGVADFIFVLCEVHFDARFHVKGLQGDPVFRLETRKFSFLRPVRMSPCCVVATTSRVTMGTSTAMVTPACGGCWGVEGDCGGEAGLCCGCAPPWRPVGAWA